MGYANYINNLSPDYWQTLEGQAFFKAFGDVGDELINDALLVEDQARIQTCAEDTLPYHFQNTYTLVSPFETPAEQRAYLSGLFDTIWKQNGSAQHLLAELKRFGFPNAKIWIWNDLVDAGIPAFGGDFTKIVGATPNTGVWYLPKGDLPLGGPGWTVEHRIAGANLPLQVTLDIPGKHLLVQLQTDGASNPLSRAIDIWNALEANPLIKDYFYYLYGGNGFGTAISSMQITLPFAYYTYYFIDLYEPNMVSAFVQWNQEGIFWNDGVTTWDEIVTGNNMGFISLLREVIRRATPSTMSCRFVRVFDQGISYNIPIADQYEEDANGNIMDFYTTHY